jgi:glycine/D-amino acid oxidase-like deaminating enzyme
LTVAALKAARHREVDLSSGTTVDEILTANGRACGVKTPRTTYSAAVVVNCAGAWAGQLPPHSFPTRPVKGQILSVIGAPALSHVVRAPEIYLVPRSDGRIVIGATSEEAGFDKRTDPQTIRNLLAAAIRIMPGLRAARIYEAWAGLRPGTPDGLPLLGETAIPGYFAATGHFREGILLAPATAQAMASLILDGGTSYDLSPFSPFRFAGDKTAIRAAV